jgi:hypothetical protein
MNVGLVTDTGGVNDQSFNQLAWEGVQNAAKDMRFQAKFIESKQPADYEMVHQHFMLVPPLTVTENIMLGKSRPLRVRGLLENWQSWTGAPSRGGSAISAANTILK